ncbi:MAG: hypothetical protein VYB44_09385 [Bacteroidota bacterium]|jgi:hypothetical protein|nr:hypothetical protein [Bacteroidota bacterium]
MEIVILNKTRRVLNTIKLITSTLFAAGFFSWALVMLFDERTAALLLFGGLLFLVLYLLTALTAWIYRPTTLVTSNEKLTLLVNSYEPLNKIEKVKDIQYSKNFLINTDTKTTIAELDRKCTFELLKSEQFEKVQANKKLSFFQNNPNGVIGVVLEWGWAAS